MAPHLIHLTRGAHYTATTPSGSVRGEYLGVETPHGDWSILLRGVTGVESVAIDAITSIDPID
jgi:hypothetical protein